MPVKMASTAICSQDHYCWAVLAPTWRPRHHQNHWQKLIFSSVGFHAILNMGLYMILNMGLYMIWIRFLYDLECGFYMILNVGFIWLRMSGFIQLRTSQSYDYKCRSSMTANVGPRRQMRADFSDVPVFRISSISEFPGTHDFFGFPVFPDFNFLEFSEYPRNFRMSLSSGHHHFFQCQSESN